jgi:hypothetical protein
VRTNYDRHQLDLRYLDINYKIVIICTNYVCFLQWIAMNIITKPCITGILITFREIVNMAVMTSVIYQTTITESTEQVNMKVRSNIRKRLPEKEVLGLARKTGCIGAVFYAQWQSAPKKRGGNRK